MRLLAAIFVLTLPIAIAACGSAATQTVTVASTVTEIQTVTVPVGSLPEDTAPASTPAGPPANPKGTRPAGGVGKSGGITLRVLSAHPSKTLHYVGGTQEAGVTPDGNPVTKKAPQGGHYEYVRTRLTNHTSKGIDLTCGAPVTATVTDDAGDDFDAVQGLDEIQGNPSCNVNLEPGFQHRMTWVFLLPRGAHATSFSFTDTTDFNVTNDSARIRLS
jgi:hypothetical protein